MHVVRLYIVRKALSSESDSNHFAGPYKKNNYAQATHIQVQNRNKTKQEKQIKQNKKARAWECVQTFFPWIFASHKELIVRELSSKYQSNEQPHNVWFTLGNILKITK